MKRFLKISSLLVALLMVAAVGYAQTLTVGSDSGVQGQTLTIPVTFTNDADNVVGLQFDVTFNTALVDITGATAGSALSGTSFGFSTSEPSAGVRRIIITPPIVTPLPTVPSGELASLTVKIVGASGTAPLALVNVSMSDASGGAVEPAALNDGTVTITVAEPDISVSPTSLDFGNVAVSSSRNRTLTISNVGNAPLTVDSITSDNTAFTIVSPTFPQTIAAGSSVNVTVRFSCTDLGNQTGDLTVSSNDPDEGTVTVPVSGTCVAAAATTTAVPTLSQWGMILLSGLLLVSAIYILRKKGLKFNI